MRTYRGSDTRRNIRTIARASDALKSAVVLNTVFGGLLRAEGSAKRSTAVQMSVAIFNMILDPFLIYSLDLGLMGAGLATVISSLLGLMIGLHWFVMNKTSISITSGDLRPTTSSRGSTPTPL